MNTAIDAVNSDSLLDELIHTFQDNKENGVDVQITRDDTTSALLQQAPNNYWLEQQELPQAMSDSYTLTIDGCSFIIFHVNAAQSELTEQSDEDSEQCKILNSYICKPFTNEYTQLQLINDSFPNIFDSDICHHEKIFDVTHINCKTQNIRHYIDVGYNWNDDKHKQTTKLGCFVYKILINIKLNTIEYVNLLTIKNSPISKDNDLRIITSLNNQHVVQLNDNVCMITGGYMEWSKTIDIILFDLQTYEYKNHKSVIPYGKPPGWYEPDISQGLVQRNKNEFILWNGFECFLMRLNVNDASTIQIMDDITFSFTKIDFVTLQKGFWEQVRFSSFVVYKKFIICIGGLRDEGDDGEWKKHDIIYVFDIEILKWYVLKDVKLSTVLCDNSSIISMNKDNGDVIVNVIGGTRWEDHKTERVRYSYPLKNHRKLYLGIEQEFRVKIWSIMKSNGVLSCNLWVIVFDMIDGGLFCVFDKPYSSQDKS